MRDFDKQMEMVFYHSDEGDVSVDAYIKDESIWITQKAMAELFGVNVPDISGLYEFCVFFTRKCVENAIRKVL